MPEAKSPVVHGFIIAVELSDPEVTPQSIMDKLGESLKWKEGISKVEVDWMGQIDIVDKDPDDTSVTIIQEKGSDA